MAHRLAVSWGNAQLLRGRSFSSKFICLDCSISASQASPAQFMERLIPPRKDQANAKAECAFAPQSRCTTAAFFDRQPTE
jgi:hypothetical protein